jgi:hypothetical protein
MPNVFVYVSGLNKNALNAIKQNKALAKIAVPSLLIK